MDKIDSALAVTMWGLALMAGYMLAMWVVTV